MTPTKPGWYWHRWGKDWAPVRVWDMHGGSGNHRLYWAADVPPLVTGNDKPLTRYKTGLLSDDEPGGEWGQRIPDPYACDFAKMAEKPLTPKVGVGVVLERDGFVLLGRRKGSHGAGKWALPAGNLEIGETLLDCAARETLEEVGIKIDGIRKIGFSNNIMDNDGLHYVSLYVKAEWEKSQEPKLMEPDKFSEICWFMIGHTPEDTFAATTAMLNAEIWLEEWKR